MNKTILMSMLAFILTGITVNDSYAQSRRDQLRNDARNRNSRNTGDGSRSNGNVNRNRGHNGRTQVDRNRPNRNRPTTGHTRVNRNRPNRNGSYGTSNYHRPYNYTPRSYNYYTHTPYRSNVNHARRRYLRTVNYYSHLRRNNRNSIYRNWIFYPTTYRTNGYFNVNNYPYYIYNGYQHRYSNMDTCNYQLVDKYNDRVIRSFYGQVCSRGYDTCAMTRDQMNSREYNNRYFCAETYKEQGYYNSNNGSYNNDNYYGDDYYDNGNYGNSNTDDYYYDNY